MTNLENEFRLLLIDSVRATRDGRMREMFDQLNDSPLINMVDSMSPLNKIFVATNNRESLRLLLEYGADIQGIHWGSCCDRIGHYNYNFNQRFNDALSPTEVHDITYHPIVAMFHEVGDYIMPIEEQSEQYPNAWSDGCTEWSLAGSMAYLNYHGSLYGLPLPFPKDYEEMSDEWRAKIDIILNNELLSRHNRKRCFLERVIYLKYPKGSMLRASLQDIVTKGLDVFAQHSLIDPIMIISTVHYASSKDLKLIKHLIMAIQNVVSPSLFQQLVNFCLAQSYKNMSLLKYFADTHHADPNVLVPTNNDTVYAFAIIYKDIIFPIITLQLWYFQEQESADIRTSTWNSLLSDINVWWNVVNQDGLFFRGYSVLHLIAENRCTGAEKRFAYLVNNHNANPFIRAWFSNNNRHRITPLELAEGRCLFDLWFIYFNKIFANCINELVFIDYALISTDTLNTPDIWITPLMYIANRKIYDRSKPHDVADNELSVAINVHKADVNIKDSKGETVLMRAIKEDRPWVVKYLMELSDKHDLNTTSSEGLKLQDVLEDHEKVKLVFMKYVPSSWWKKRSLKEG